MKTATEVAHTPGPWKLASGPTKEEAIEAIRQGKAYPSEGSQLFRDNDGSFVIVTKDGERIGTAAFQGKAKRGEMWRTPNPEGEANARLMAQSPRLVEAIRETLRVLGRVEFPRDPEEQGMVNRLRDALDAFETSIG